MTNWQQRLDNHPLLDAASIGSDQNCLVILSEYRLLTVSGPDSVTFLQGQCTCDISQLNSGHWLLGAHCNIKGRMHSSFYAARIDENTIGLRLHSSIAENALNALKKYSVFSKVELTLAPAWIMGLNHPDQSTLPNTTIKLPPVNETSHPENGLTVLRLDKNRSEIWASQAAALDHLWPHITQGLNLTSQAVWSRLNIEQGIAEVRAETVEALLPQELNFQLINGVSFSKGCYTGQEIIARLHYKATLKKHLYRATTALLDNESSPIYGTEIVDKDTGKRLGSVIQSLSGNNNQWLLLVLVNDLAVHTDSAVLALGSQPKLTWQPLPYAIP